MTKSILIKIIFSLALLGLLALKIDYSQLAATAQNIHPLSWVIAMIFVFVQILALSARWSLLLNVNKSRRLHFMTSLRMSLVGFLANYVFITSLGGIVTRIVLSMSHGFLFVKLLAATVVDRAMTLLALILLTIVFLPIAGQEFYPDQNLAIIGMVFAGLAAFALLILYHYRRAIIFLHRKITVCVKYLRNLFTNPVLLTKIVAVSLVSQIAYFLAVYAVMISLHKDFSFVQFMAVMPVITLVSTLPIGYGGWGIREGAFIYGFSLMHVPAEVAFMTSVQMGLLSMAFAMATGIPVFLGKETQTALKNKKENKKARDAAAAHI